MSINAQIISILKLVFMGKVITLLFMLVSIFLLSACTTAPKREPYAGPDQVGEVDSTLLVGHWKINVLNPIGEENKNIITQSYNQDGTWESTVIPPAEQTDQFGELQYKGEGQWQVNGDMIVSNLNSLEETTGNKLGGMMQAIVSALIPKSSTVNVYEVSESRIVLVHEKTGQATALERI